MGSDVRSVGEAVSALADGLDSLSGRELADRLVELERVVRRTEAAIVAVVAEADRAGAWREDGHASVRGWARATVRWSDVEVRDRIRTVTLLHDIPTVRAELAAARIGVAQVRELGRCRANPRCGDQLADAADVLVEHAEALPFEQFRIVTRRWEALADADGAHRSHEAAHEQRRGEIHQLGDVFYLDGRFGVAQGMTIREIFANFEQAEFDAEWAELRARLGDDASAAQMDRTAAQRRADALLAVFLAAASAAPGSVPPEPVVNILIDEASWLAHLANSLGDDDVPLPDPTTVADRCCQTPDWVQFDPADAIVAAAVGRVRRVVRDSRGVTIDLGHTQRLFTGSSRLAVFLQGDRCLWPGCGRRRCQIDHLTEWSRLGPTDPANGGPGCGRHNRWKNRGYRVHRDEHGRWHTYRPDGTEIAAA